MPLILAIEPDKRQSSQLASVVKGLQAELVQRANAADGLAALQGRVPDLVLTSSLISPRDDSALAAHLRGLGAAAAHVQTVTIPLLGSDAPRRAKGGMLAALRREKPQAPMTDGCAPDVFAEQVRQYLATAEEQRVTTATRLVVAPDAAGEEAAVTAEPAAVETFEPVAAEAFEPVAAKPIEAAPAHEDLPEAVIEEPTPVAEEILPEELVADEPAGLPLSQLLQLVSETAAVAEPRVSEPVAEEIAVEEFVETAPVVEELCVDPMAAQALDELSREAPAQSLADGIPAEAPVPVVEMHAFQSLDSIASELAAGPVQPQESLDDLASLFAATPSPDNFSSLFAEPATSRVAEPINVPGIDASLFAGFDAAEPALPEPEPVLAAMPGPVLEIAPEPVIEAAPEPVVEVAPEILLTEFEVPEPEPVLAAAFEAEPEPVFEDGPIAFEAIVFEPVMFEPVMFEPVMFERVAEEAVVANSAPALDDEIALDVDAFTFTAPEPTAPAPAEPSRFSFTLVDGFGDALSDFEVQSAAGVAADLGVGEHAPSDPYAVDAARAAAARHTLNEPIGAPVLDEEALLLIGDAARKVGLDAMVIEEFERGFQARRLKKTKKKAHAGATPLPTAAERAAKSPKRPVQDEWGMFDPEQCGFAALEDEEGAEKGPTTGTRVRVISY